MTNAKGKGKAAGGRARGRRKPALPSSSGGEAARTRMKKRILALEARYATLKAQVDELIKRLIDRGDLL